MVELYTISVRDSKVKCPVQQCELKVRDCFGCSRMRAVDMGKGLLKCAGEPVERVSRTNQNAKTATG